jgi:hypothetical protein
MEFITEEKKEEYYTYLKELLPSYIEFEDNYETVYWKLLNIYKNNKVEKESYDLIVDKIPFEDAVKKTCDIIDTQFKNKCIHENFISHELWFPLKDKIKYAVTIHNYTSLFDFVDYHTIPKPGITPESDKIYFDDTIFNNEIFDLLVTLLINYVFKYIIKKLYITSTSHNLINFYIYFEYDET